MNINAKKPENVVVALNMNADAREITDLIQMIEKHPATFRYTCGYRGRVVDMSEVIDIVNNKEIPINNKFGR